MLPMTCPCKMACFVTSLCVASSATAGLIDVHTGSQTTQLRSGLIESMFQKTDDGISGDDLITLNETLLEDGITTEGAISVFFADTAQGLSLITLIGGSDGFADKTPGPSLLGLSLLWDGTEDTSLVNLDSGGYWSASMIGEDQMFGSGAFQWEHGLTWEAMALTQMVEGQTFDLDFVDLGIWPHAGNEVVVQLITFGDTGAWEVAKAEPFDDSHQIMMDGVILIPAPAALSLLAIGGLRARRRR